MIKVVLRNTKNGQLADYDIEPFDHELAQLWQDKLEQDILANSKLLEKTFCFHGFPNTDRDLAQIATELNRHIQTINEYNPTWVQAGLKPYIIEDYFVENSFRFPDTYETRKNPSAQEKYHYLGLQLKHDTMNNLHRYFEDLQGTVDNPSPYGRTASPEVSFAIRQLNNLCHEAETLVLSQRKLRLDPEWIRPSQITTFLKAERYPLPDSTRYLFEQNSYDRRFAHVYMHWCQIGKTWFEVFRDEGDITLDQATCSAITNLEYYSGEFDVEWAKDVTEQDHPWHRDEVQALYDWLERNNIEPDAAGMSLGHLPLGKIDTWKAFGTDDPQLCWQLMSNYLDVYQIESGKYKATYDYSWRDSDWEKRQIGYLS